MPFKSQQNAAISIPFLLLLSTLVAFGPLSIDLYLPSLPNIAQELQSTNTQIQWTISGFLIGFCVGMLFYGPLSDRYGRKPILLIGIFLYLITSLACYQSSSASQLILFRVLQALGGGAASVLARAMVKDLLPLKKAVRVLSLMHVVTMIAPLLAPLIGGYLMLAFGWRSLFLVLFIFALFCFIAVLFIRETLPKEKRGGSISVAGYTICNDYAIRDYLENYYRPNLRVKNRDSTTPVGPYIITTDEVPDPSTLTLRTWINGELKQEGTTADMIFNVPYLIEYLSSFMTLQPGDMIATGTPKGLADVKPGDKVVVEMEGIGSLTNFIVTESEYFKKYGTNALGE